MDKNDLIALRLYNESTDKNFILATWLRGLYYGDTWFKEIPKNIFMTKYHTVLENLLRSPDTVITVCCLKEDQDVILGYSVSSLNRPILHWVFVKAAWRNIKIGKSLVSSEAKTVTHLTKVGLAIAKKKGLIFDPFQ